MKRMAPFVFSAVLLGLGGCAESVPEAKLDPVRAGMTREEVQAAIGPPQSATYTPGQDCSYYTVMKSFFRRTPWSTTERYVVCYGDGRVETFGRVEGAEKRQS
jgi:hypothetical protein